MKLWPLCCIIIRSASKVFHGEDDGAASSFATCNRSMQAKSIGYKEQCVISYVVEPCNPNTLLLEMVGRAWKGKQNRGRGAGGAE